MKFKNSVLWPQCYETRYQLQEKKQQKNTNSWRLNNTLLNNKDVTGEIRNQKIPRNKWQWKHDNPKPMGLSKSNSKRGVYSDTIIPQEARKASNRQPSCTSKAAGKRRTKNPQSQQKEGEHKNQSRNKKKWRSPGLVERKKIIKNKAEINEKETKKSITKPTKQKAGALRR